jgi:hypothetical protein
LPDGFARLQTGLCAARQGFSNAFSGFKFLCIKAMQAAAYVIGQISADYGFCSLMPNKTKEVS